MTSLSEISLVHVPSPPEGAAAASVRDAIPAWSPAELPPAPRPSPLVLVVLALLAGIAAMVLGALAVVSATKDAQTVTPAAPVAAAGVETRVLSLLAKPSTARVVFRGTSGRLVLAVGSGGRAAILVRGFERAPAGQPYSAWVVRSGKPVRAARFTGAENAVLLSVPVGRGQSVVVAHERPTRLRLSAQGIAAVRA